MQISNRIILGSGIVITVLLVAGFIFMGKERHERAKIIVNDFELSVRVADSALERRQGLSGFELDTLNADGMLFIFPEAEVQNFWMKGMKFPLDVAWIKDGKVVSVDTNIPAPKPGEEPARMSSSPIGVDMVLELPAGQAYAHNIKPGIILKIDR